MDARYQEQRRVRCSCLTSTALCTKGVVTVWSADEQKRIVLAILCMRSSPELLKLDRANLPSKNQESFLSIKPIQPNRVSDD